MNLELGKISDWISSNYLSINVDKTVYLLFSGKKPTPPHMKLEIFRKEVHLKTNTKFLGIYIDNKLNWKAHIQYATAKISCMIGIISKLQSCLTIPAMRTLYLSLVHNHLRYGLTFWGAANKSELNKIFILQKKMIRIIHRADYLAHTDPLFQRSFILKLNDMRRIEMCKFIYTDLNRVNHFQFSTRTETHGHDTRNRNLLNLPIPRSNILRNSVFFQGIQDYNEIYDHVKLAPSRNSFKYQIKKEIVSMYSS